MKQKISRSRTSLLAVFLAGAMALPGTASAQATPGREDLRALRFYVQNNETTAIDAEIRRLEAEFPGWTPPSDLNRLLLIEPTTEVADIYARLARGDVAGARATLGRTQERFPSWSAPDDLTRQLDMAEGQIAFDRAVNVRDVNAAVRIGSQMPALFRCDRINNAWNLAELHASTGSKSRALTTYTQVVNTCTSIPELVATIEKAEAVSTDGQLTALIGVAKRRNPSNASTFDDLGTRLLAGRGRGTATPTAAPVVRTAAPAKPRTTTPPAPTRTRITAPPPVRTPEVVVNNGPIATYSTPELNSLPRSGDGRLGETRAAKVAGNFRQCLANSVNPRSIDVAYERGWCAYNLERALEAIAYFSAASQAGMSGDVPRDSRFGLTLALLKRKMVDDAAQVAASTALTETQRREVEIIILDQRGINAYNAKEYSAAVEYFNALEQVQGDLRRDLAILRGYAYLNMGDRAAARAQFQLLHDVLATPETRKALSAAR